MTTKYLTVAILGICLTVVQCQMDWFDMVMGDNSRINDNVQAIPDPPPHEQYARMARYIVHYSYWGSLSHISYHKDTLGYPITRVYSISDGPIEKSSGVPYFFVTFRDDEILDIARDNRVTLTVTLDQGDFCKRKSWITEDPRCPQVILTGNFIFLPNITIEAKVAERAMFSRFPVMKTWPRTHGFFFAKVQIRKIGLVDWFGGQNYPSIRDYFSANVTTDSYPEENSYPYDSIF